MTQRRLAQLFLLVTFAICGARSHAQTSDIRVTAGLSAQQVMVGEPVTLTLRIDGTRAAPAPDIPSLKDMILTPLGGNDISSSSTYIINGRRTETRTEAYVYRYQLVPKKAGVLEIPPVVVTISGTAYQSSPLQLRVTSPESDGLMSLQITAERNEAFVGEPILITIDWLTARQPASADFTLLAGDGDIDWTEAPPPPGTPDSMKEIPFLEGTTTARMQQVERDGQAYLRFTFQKYIIPKRAGTITLGPLSITSDLVVRHSRSLFEQDVTRRSVAMSNSMQFTVNPLPKEGQPGNFNGLIGRYSVQAAAAPTAVNVGDPITMSVTVVGPMLERIPAIELERQPQFAQKFRISEQVTTARRGGSVQFTYTIRARASDVESIPPIELPYFDTQRGSYEVARSEPIRLEVDRTRIITSADAEGLNGSLSQGETIESQLFGIRHNVASDKALKNQAFSLGLALRDPIVLGATTAPPAAWALGSFIVVLRRRRRAGASRRPRKIVSDAILRINRLQAEQPSEASDEIARAIREGVGAVSGRSGVGLTPSECEELVARISKDAAEQTRKILESCDAARFGGLSEADVSRLRSEAVGVLASLQRNAGRPR